MKNVCKYAFLRPTGFSRRFGCNDPAWTPHPTSTTQLFFRVRLPTLSLAILTFFLPVTTSAISGTWNCNKSVSTRLAAGTKYFTQKGNCDSPNTLCSWTESPPKFSTNTSTEWNLHLSWSNHLVTCFRLEIEVGGFSKHQNKTSDTDRYKRYYLTAGVSQVNVNTMTRTFEPLSELQVAEWLIVNGLSSSYKVSCFGFELKGKWQQNSLHVTNDFVLD